MHEAERGCASQPQPRFLLAFALLMILVTVDHPTSIFSFEENAVKTKTDKMQARRVMRISALPVPNHGRLDRG
jgi:hypothetical protein